MTVALQKGKVLQKTESLKNHLYLTAIMEEQEIHRLKIGGPLANTRNTFAILRDILIITILLVLILGMLGIIFMISSGKLNSILILPGLISTFRAGGPSALIADLQNDVNMEKWDVALKKLDAIELASHKLGLPPGSYQIINELKLALQNKDKIKFNEAINTINLNGTINTVKLNETGGEKNE